MNAVLLALLYLATSLALALLVGLLRHRPSVVATLTLTLLPLVFVASGFRPQRVLAPTLMLTEVAPWVDPELVDQVKPVSSSPNPLLLDPLSQMDPWRRAAREHLLFNPAQGGGAALLGNGQSAALFPLEVLARLLPPVRAATYVQAARLLLAVWGLYLLARGLALSEPAAVLAAASFLGSGFLQLWRAHPHTYVLAMAPWILFGFSELARRPGVRSSLVLAVSGALGALGGHPEILLYVVVLGSALLVVGALGSPRRPAALVGWGVVAAVLSLLLAAPALLPFINNLRASAEWQLRRSQPQDLVEETLDRALERLVPAVSHLGLGDPGDGTWRGPENIAELAGGSTGGAVLVLVPVALATRRRRRVAAVWLAVGVLGLLVSAHFPWVSKPFGLLPLFKESLLKRLSLWWVLTAAVLVGLAVDSLRRDRGRTALAVGVVALSLLLALVAAAHPEARTVSAAGLELGGMVVGVTGALLLSARRHRGAWPARTDATAGNGNWSANSRVRVWSPPTALCLLLFAILVPRAALFSRWIPVTSSLSFYPDTLAIQFVQERAHGWRVAGLDAALIPNSAAFFGLEDVRANDPMTLAAYQAFSVTLGEGRRAQWNRILDPALPALDFLGVRFVFDHPSMFPPPGVELIYRGRDAVIYENPEALPRLFIPRQCRVFNDHESSLHEAVRIQDYGRDAYVSGPGLPPPGLYPNGEAVVRRLELSSEGRISAALTVREPTLVATSQPAIPGWRLFVDGVSTESVRVNGAFLAAVLPEGEHRLEFRYAPKAWSWGVGLGALGILATLGMWAAARRSPHRRATG